MTTAHFTLFDTPIGTCSLVWKGDKNAYPITATTFVVMPKRNRVVLPFCGVRNM